MSPPAAQHCRGPGATYSMARLHSKLCRFGPKKEHASMSSENLVCRIEADAGASSPTAALLSWTTSERLAAVTRARTRARSD
jgi:hypothetical protein